MSEKSSILRVLQSPEAFTCVLHAFLSKQYGEDYLYWDPTTVWLELRDDYGINLDTDVMDKLSSAQVVMTSDGFFKRVDAFSALCNTLTSGAPSFSVFDPVTPEEMVWAYIEVAIMRDLLPMSPSVAQYAAAIVAGQEDHPVVKFMLRDHGEDIPRKELFQIISECASRPATLLDAFIADQLKDIRSQSVNAGVLLDLPEELR